MLGYIGIYAAAEKASGTDIARKVTAGGKDYAPDSKGVVMVGPPLVLNEENIDDVNSDRTAPGRGRVRLPTEDLS